MIDYSNALREMSLATADGKGRMALKFIGTSGDAEFYNFTDPSGADHKIVVSNAERAVDGDGGQVALARKIAAIGLKLTPREVA